MGGAADLGQLCLWTPGPEVCCSGRAPWGPRPRCSVQSRRGHRHTWRGSENSRRRRCPPSDAVLEPFQPMAMGLPCTPTPGNHPRTSHKLRGALPGLTTFSPSSSPARHHSVGTQEPGSWVSVLRPIRSLRVWPCAPVLPCLPVRWRSWAPVIVCVVGVSPP